jgi:hypothetical protein
VAIVDVALVQPPQTRHALHQSVGIPDLDLLDANPYFHHLANQTRRHGIAVVLHHHCAAPAHAQISSFLRLQTLSRQGVQNRQLGRQRRLTSAVALYDQVAQEHLVAAAISKIATATQQQRLRYGFFEPPMTLLTVAVLVSARRVGGLRDDAIVSHQGLILGRKFISPAIGPYRQTHAIGAVSLRHTA